MWSIHFLTTQLKYSGRKMTAEHIVSDIDAALAKSNSQLEIICRLTAAECTYEEFFISLGSKDRVGQAWNRINHLNSLCNTPERRQAIQQRLGDVSAFWWTVSQSSPLDSCLTSC